MADPVPKSIQSETIINKKRNCNNNEDYILSDDCLLSIKSIIHNEFGINSYELNSECISICGENSYGAILELEIIPKKIKKQLFNNTINNNNNNNNNKLISTLSSSSSSTSSSIETIIPSSINNDNKLIEISSSSIPDKNFYLIVKLSPKKLARRKAMKVVEYYEREIFIYRNVITQYKQLNINNNININLQYNSSPIYYNGSLKYLDEYLILEDLIQNGYIRYSRQKILTYHHCNLALIELAKFHAMSFILRENNKNLYYKLIDQIRYDNLFTDDIEPISIEFSQKYLKKTLNIIEEININDNIFIDKDNILKKLNKIVNIFHELCVELVDGELTEPYSVICHGDFWNNNILYKYDNETGLPIEAKVIDYQMARYASPVLDFVHYLFACTEKSLRDKHFHQFKDIYYNTLDSHLKLFKLDSNIIYPRYMFEKQLRSHGIYGFCMAIYAMPFFISDNSDIPDLDEVAEKIHNITDNNNLPQNNDDDNINIINNKTTLLNNDHNNTDNNNINNKLNKNNSNNIKTTSTTDLLKNYEMLNDRTYPIYRQRMIGVVQDLEKYDLLKPVMLFKHKYSNLCVLK